MNPKLKGLPAYIAAAQPDAKTTGTGALAFLTEAGTLNIEAAAAQPGDAPKLPTFSVLAYAGGPMSLEGWRFPVIVDLAGLAVPSQARPVRHAHDRQQRIGHTTAITNDGKQLSATGVISGTGPAARELVADSKNGFPFQASIGAAVHEHEFIREGGVVAVNGRQFSGPVNVVRKSTLGEISFLDLGADGSTSVNVAASADAGTVDATLVPAPIAASHAATSHKEVPPMKPFAQWLEAKGFVLADLTDDQKSVLQAAYDAEKAKLEAANAPASGAAPPAPPVQAAEPAAPPAQPPGPSPAILHARAEAAAEFTRVAAIHKIADKHPDIEAQAVREGWDAERTELHVLRASRASAPALIQGSSFAAGDRKAIVATALLSGGMPGDRLLAAYGQPAVDFADRYRGIGIQDFFRLVAAAEGINLPPCVGTGSEFIRAAFSVISLPGILANVAHKLLLEGYNYVESVWRDIAAVGTVTDFKVHTRYRMTADAKFEALGPAGELKHGELDEQSFTSQADTLGKLFALTRKQIIDDDLGAFAAIPREIGIGAGEAIAEALWTLILSNPSSFFSSGHKNYSTGATTALGIDSLSAAKQLFADQTKPNGRPLGLLPATLLTATSNADMAVRLMSADYINELTETSKPKPNINPHKGTIGKNRVSAYLGNSSISGYSQLAWYLFADPRVLAAFRVVFLNGVEEPTVEQADTDFSTLGVQFRGYLDFGVGAEDYRAAVKMKGEA